MKLHVLYDNSMPASDRVQALIGIDRFGRLIFKRRTLLSILQSAANAARLAPPIEFNAASDWLSLESRLRGGEFADDLFLICPANIVASQGSTALTTFLRQVRHAPGNLVLPARSGVEWDGWAVMSAPLLRSYLRKRDEQDLPGFFEQHRSEFVRIEDRLGLIDLNDEGVLLEFLSGTFDARFFNAIAREAYVVTKRSTDKAKLEREYAFFGLLPPLMQMFFIRPFDFKDEGSSASYRMERLFVPDMAVQWLHGALSRSEFKRFLEQVFYFVSVRTRRRVTAAEAERQVESLYVTKVRDRLDSLKRLPEYAKLEPLFDRAIGGIDHLFRRYLNLFQRLRKRFPSDHLVIGHGDLCFSNILYSKTAQNMKLIDPRGATDEQDLYTNPYYDIAKLSHSVLGNYDFINQDFFDIHVGEALDLKLLIDRPGVDWPRELFTELVSDAGFDLTLTRVCEASLFISMLPLHIDRPRKVLGFALNAVSVLDDVEANL